MCFHCDKCYHVTELVRKLTWMFLSFSRIEVNEQYFLSTFTVKFKHGILMKALANRNLSLSVLTWLLGSLSWKVRRLFILLELSPSIVSSLYAGYFSCFCCRLIIFSKDHFRDTIRVSNCMDPDQTQYTESK